MFDCVSYIELRQRNPSPSSGCSIHIDPSKGKFRPNTPELNSKQERRFISLETIKACSQKFREITSLNINQLVKPKQHETAGV